MRPLLRSVRCWAVAAGAIAFTSELLLAGSLLTFQGKHIAHAAPGGPSRLRERLADALVIAMFYLPVGSHVGAVGLRGLRHELALLLPRLVCVGALRLGNGRTEASSCGMNRRPPPRPTIAIEDPLLPFRGTNVMKLPLVAASPPPFQMHVFVAVVALTFMVLPPAHAAALWLGGLFVYYRSAGRGCARAAACLKQPPCMPAAALRLGPPSVAHASVTPSPPLQRHRLWVARAHWAPRVACHAEMGGGAAGARAARLARCVRPHGS